MSMTIAERSTRFVGVVEANCPTHGVVGIAHSIEQAEDQAIDHDMAEHPRQFAA